MGLLMGILKRIFSGSKDLYRVLSKILPKTMNASHRNPTLFCTAFGIGAFAISLAYLFMQGLTFSLFVRALAIGFFAGSMTFSILSLQNKAAVAGKDGTSRLVSLILISLIVGAAVALPFFLSDDLSKAAEILIIVAGLSSLLVG